MAPQSTQICTGLNWLPCACTVFAGVAIVAILLLGTDEAARLLDFYPPWRQPMSSSRVNSLMLSLRVSYAVFGSYFLNRFDWGRTR